jgi:hypothetical protein
MQPTLIVYDSKTGTENYLPDDDRSGMLADKFRDVFVREDELPPVYDGKRSPVAEVEELYSFGDEKVSVVSRDLGNLKFVMISSLKPDDADKYLGWMMKNPRDVQKILDKATDAKSRLSPRDFSEKVEPVLRYDLSGDDIQIEILDHSYKGGKDVEELGLLHYYSAPLYAYGVLSAFFDKDSVVVTAERAPLSLGKIPRGTITSEILSRIELPSTYYHRMDFDSKSGTVFRQSFGGKRLSTYLRE